MCRFYKEVRSAHVHEHTHKNKLRHIGGISFVIDNSHIFYNQKLP